MSEVTALENICWKVTDPLGNEIYLKENNFIWHIVGRHNSKDAEIRAKIEPQAKFTVEHPRLIIRDIQAAGRVKYLSLADVQDDVKIAVRTIDVVVDENSEVVTWFAKRTVNVNVQEDGGIIYDRRIHHL